MGCNISFFARVGDEFALLGTFGRCSFIYEVTRQWAPWQKVRPLGDAELQDLRCKAEDSLAQVREDKQRSEERIQLILQMDGSVNERLDAITEEQGAIMSYKLDAAEREEAVNFFTFLLSMNHNIEFVEYKNMTHDRYIYVGMEVNEESPEIQS